MRFARIHRSEVEDVSFENLIEKQYKTGDSIFFLKMYVQVRQMILFYVLLHEVYEKPQLERMFSLDYGAWIDYPLSLALKI